MSFMELHVTQKGALYTADCSKCGATIHAHEWAHPDPNGARDAMQDGTLRCDQCHGTADPETFHDHGRKYYAARYSANGYMDCTDWNYGTNKRALIRETREMYGE
jgi:hypothetical protein